MLYSIFFWGLKTQRGLWLMKRVINLFNLHNIMSILQDKVIKILEESIGEDNILIESPPDSKLGDFAIPCFQFAKKYKKSPNEIAKELSQKINDSFIEKVEIVGPYLNVFVNKEKAFELFFKQRQIPKKQKEKIIIEYMNANPNKPLHIGQARNIAIGDTFTRILRHEGFNVDAINYGDDSGVNVGYNIVGHLYYDFPLESNKKFDHYCGEIYTKMRSRDDDSKFKELLTKTLLSIEKEDKEILKIQQDYTKKCAIAQFESCWKLNSFFNLVNWETDILHLKLFEEAFEKLKKQGHILFSKEGNSKNCWILDLSSYDEFKGMENPYQVLVKSDGVATYVAKDIAYAMWKLGFLKKDFHYKKFVKQPNKDYIYSTSSNPKDNEDNSFGNYDKSFAVIDNRQSHAQNVVKKALSLSGYLDSTKEYHHLSYGVVYLTPKTLESFGFNLSDDEKQEKRLPFSSRKGWFVTIDETFDLLKKKAFEESKKRNTDKGNDWLNDVAEKVALGAMRFYLLRTDISQDITFDIDEALDMKGDTGMYVLYTYARINSIFEKEDFQNNPKINYCLLNEDLEFEMIKELMNKDKIIIQSYQNLAPNLLCNYLLKLCQLFNSYYAKTHILKSEPKTKIARLTLLNKLRDEFKEIMNLIGMKEIERV